jgi:hypothetical protein
VIGRGRQLSPPTPRSASAIFEKGFKAPFLQASERPFVKLLNWYTGFGKTYTAAAFSIDLFVNCDVIPVFIAPLQSLVAGFSEEVKQHQKSRKYADEIEAAVLARGVQIPVHRLYSIEYHLNDRSFFQACLSLVAWLEHHRDVSARMELSAKHAETDKGVRARVTELRQKAAFCEQSSFLGMSPSDESYDDTRSAYIKAAQRARSLADSLVWKLIQLDIETRGQKRDDERLMRVNEVGELVRRLHPLQAFLDNPGIIVSTASKAQVGHKVFGSDGKGSFKTHKFDNLPLFLEELNRDDSPFGRMVSKRPDSARVVTFVDEEEDSYWYLFDQRKSVVNSGGRNDLNLVISEFFQYFDLKWPMAFEELRRDGPRLDLATKVYEHLEDFAKVSMAVEDDFAIEASKTSAKYISDARRVEILRTHLTTQCASTAKSFNDTELLTVLNELHDRNDAHAAFKRFRQKARVLQRIRSYILEITPPGYTTYETFRDLHDRVANKKFFTMSRSTYGEVLDQPGQTFFTESASVMDTEFLRQVQLSKDTAHQTIRLHYHDGDIPPGAYTLLDYLKLVVFMAKVLAQTSGEDTIEMSKTDQERYPSLNRFRQDVRQLFEGKAASEGLSTESSDKELLTDAFLFESTKSVVTLEESRVQAEEYNMTADVSLTLTITSLRATPEEDIVRALGRTNGVYLMSATGGLDSASSGAFNTKHLRRCIEARGGHFAEMGEDELEVVAAKAEDMLGKRERNVVILDDTDPAPKFGVSKAYKGLLQVFEDARPKKDESGYAQMNRHKRTELAGLVASLDRLLSSSVRSGLVLCQTTMHVRKCLMRLANMNSGLVRQVDTTGDHFIIRPRAIPTYNEYGVQEEVTVILYSAGRFRNKDRSKTGALQEDDDQGQFNKELEDALDISRKKVLLWSAYASASRGINFLTTQNRKERDFELFCLLNDPYYTRHTRLGTGGFSMEMFQSFAQVLRDENENWAAMSKGDLLFEYSRNRWRRLRKEHFIDITRTVFQALGRGERRPDTAMPVQHLYVSSEAARMVHLGLRHAPELRKRASPAQRAVLAQLGNHNAETSIFPTESVREADHRDSLKKAVAFRRFTSQTPGRFRSDPAARNVWERLFDSTMFGDPLKYLEKLETAGVPAEYRNGCYVEVPVKAEAYTCQYALSGIAETMVTDAYDGTDAYNWIAMVAPEGLVSQMSSKTQGHLREWRGFKLPDKTKRLLPQPWFVTEIMKGYIAELEFEEYIGSQFNVWPKNLALGGGPVEYLQVVEHPLYAELYQMFDYYLVPEPNVLIAVDLKNWARSTDSLKKMQLQEEAQKKHQRLRELLPDTTVHALYVNLYGAHKFAVSKPAAGTIRFMSLFVPNTGANMWMPNANLREAVLGK